jgi:hypothetical protein
MVRLALGLVIDLDAEPRAFSRSHRGCLATDQGHGADEPSSHD